MANIQTIELRESMFDNVRNGIKIATLRNGKRDYHIGDAILYGNEHKNAVFIKITNVKFKLLKDITDDDAKQEGYTNRDGLISVMKDIYKDITDDSIVTQAFFRYISG